MKIAFLKKIRKILDNCQSIDEFKCYCATHGIDIPSNELSFAKWFYDLIVVPRPQGSVSQLKYSSSAMQANLQVRNIDYWRKRFQKYLNENIDEIVTQQKFKNLLSTYLYTLIEEEKEWIQIHCPSKEDEYENKYNRITPKQRLKMIWKQKNKLNFTDFNMMLVLTYFKKHGLQLSTT